MPKNRWHVYQLGLSGNEGQNEEDCKDNQFHVNKIKIADLL